MTAEPMPAPLPGYACCRVNDGRPHLLAHGATVQVSHLVLHVPSGFRGDTLCGLTRFDSKLRRADLPGWSMNGGVYGPNVTQEKCAACWDAWTPYVRTVSSGRIHHHSCGVKGKGVPVTRSELRMIARHLTPHTVTAECCGASPAMWLELNDRGES